MSRALALEPGVLGDSIEVDEALLVLKIAFLVLLYVFIWRIVRSASKDIRSPQESFVSPPQPGAVPHRQGAGRLVVVKSATLPTGEEHVLDGAPLTVGRGPQNDVELQGDDFASATHARFDARADGVWVDDVGSTNGTFVNGVRLAAARRLASGDVVRIGGTDLRYQP